MIFLPEMSAYFVIGGYDYENYATVAKFQEGAWSNAGQLITGRDVSFCFLLNIY